MNLLNALRSTIFSLTLLTSSLAISGEAATATEIILAQKERVETKIAQLKDLRELLGRFKKSYETKMGIEGREGVALLASSGIVLSALSGVITIEQVLGKGVKTKTKLILAGVTLTLSFLTYEGFDYIDASIDEINQMEAEIAKKEFELKIELKVFTKLLKEMDLE